MKNVILFICLLNSVALKAQQQKIDSLAKIISNSNTQDSIKAQAYLNLTEYLYLRNFDTIIPLSNKVIAIAENNLKKNLAVKDKNKFLAYKATAINNIGVYYLNSGKPDSAISNYQQTKAIQEKIKDYDGLATTYYNMASIYEKQGKIEEALHYYNKALKIAKREKFYNQIAMNCLSLAVLFEKQNEIEKALAYFNEAMKNYTKMNNKYGISMVNHNLGGFYNRRKEHDKALEYYKKALTIKEEIGDYIGMGYTLNNLANIYLLKKENKEALNLFNRSYNLFLSQNYKDGIANSSGNLSKIYLLNGDVANALKHGEQAFKLSKEIGYPENIRNASLALYNVYDKLKKYDKAIQYYRIYCEMRDSIVNDKTRKASLEASMQHEYDKKVLKDSLERKLEQDINASEKAKLDAEIKAKTNMQILLFGGLGLVIIFSAFMYNRFRITRNQKRIIEEQKKEVTQQKHIVEEKHREITDSINYAERIQRSFLATREILDENLKDYFVLFQPKDVVSGDFYWASKLVNGNFAYCCADSTGHGVPGAIMSILNISSLEKSIETKTNPADILNETRKIIIERLKKDGSNDGGKDGMDASLIVFNKEKSKLFCASANNPVWILRNSEFIEIEAEKMPVGKHDLDNIAFTQKEFDLQKGDLIYSLTDGMPDQFGGPKGKKYKYTKLKEFLVSNASLPMKIQAEKLEQEFTIWKGDLEQVDDVCVIGVRI